MLLLSIKLSRPESMACTARQYLITYLGTPFPLQLGELRLRPRPCPPVVVAVMMRMGDGTAAEEGEQGSVQDYCAAGKHEPSHGGQRGMKIVHQGR